MEDYPRSLLKMERRFSTETACQKYLFSLRWPEGYVCLRCGGRKSWLTRRGLWLCSGCRRQSSVTAGTIFQDTRLPLQVWFRAIWQVTSQKTGVSAISIQKALGLGSYETAWAMLQKLRRAMVRPGRDRLSGRIEVDETYLGGVTEGSRGRGLEGKALVVLAAQEDGKGIGRIRLRNVPDASAASLQGFIVESIEPGSTVCTDGWRGYEGLNTKGYKHEVKILHGRGKDAATRLLPRVHRVVSLLRRWIMGTHHGAVGKAHLGYYLDEFTFRFNRRTSASRGKLFYRLLQQAVQVEPKPYRDLVYHNL